MINNREYMISVNKELDSLTQRNQRCEKFLSDMDLNHGSSSTVEIYNEFLANLTRLSQFCLEYEEIADNYFCQLEIIILRMFHNLGTGKILNMPNVNYDSLIENLTTAMGRQKGLMMKHRHDSHQLLRTLHSNVLVSINDGSNGELMAYRSSIKSIASALFQGQSRYLHSLFDQLKNHTYTLFQQDEDMAKHNIQF